MRNAQIAVMALTFTIGFGKINSAQALTEAPAAIVATTNWNVSSQTIKTCEGATAVKVPRQLIGSYVGKSRFYRRVDYSGQVESFHVYFKVSVSEKVSLHCKASKI